MNNKKLTKSMKDKKIAGVCGGIAKYLDIDSTIVRLVWVLITLLYGTGLIIYIVAALVMPEPEQTVTFPQPTTEENICPQSNNETAEVENVDVVIE